MSDLWSKSFGTLRWFRKKDGTLILQELWVKTFNESQEEWREIPVVDDEVDEEGKEL